MIVLEIFSLVSQSLSHILGNNIASVFRRDWKLKFCFRNSIFGPFEAKIWVLVGSRIHLLACLFALCQLRSFPHEFTEKCLLVVFDQSSHAIYLVWYWSLLFFQGFPSIIPFTVWLQDASQIKGRGTFLCLA